MVRTRSKSLFIERQNHYDLFGAIVESARNRRTFDPQKSPRKKSISKQQRKAKRNSMSFERILLGMKENLTKVRTIEWRFYWFQDILFIFHQAIMDQFLWLGHRSQFTRSPTGTTKHCRPNSSCNKKRRRQKESSTRFSTNSSANSSTESSTRWW